MKTLKIINPQKTVRVTALVVADLILINLSQFLALYIRFEFSMKELMDSGFLVSIIRFAPAYTLMCIALFALFGLYDSLWAYVSLTEAVHTGEAAVLAGDKAPESFAPVAEEDSSGTVVEKIQQTEGAISYLAFSYYDDTKFRALKVDGVEPCAENVCSGEFNIWAYEHMYTAADADAATKAFLDFMMSDEVQGSLVEEEGFIPVSDMKVAKDAKGNVSSK